MTLEAHGGCVAVEGRGALILGAAGVGKSRLALDLIALGANLVADDRTRLIPVSGAVIASPPAMIEGLIEARGVGLLRLPYAGPTPVTLVVDLDVTECDRLPPLRKRCLCGVALPLIHGGVAPSAIMAILRHGPPLDPEAPVTAG